MADGNVNDDVHRRAGAPRIAALTGVRGIAACWVLLFHAVETYRGLLGLPAKIDMIGVRSGYLGVDLFFLLSGFVLTWTYGATLTARTSSFIRTFVLGRLFRILPLHWAVLFALGAARALAPHQFWGPGPFSGLSLVASAVLVQAWIGQPLAWNNVTWSLSAEWLAYAGFLALLPLSGFVRSARRASVLTLACLAPLGLLTLGVSDHSLDHAERLGLARCGCEFAAGMLLCRGARVGLAEVVAPNRLFCLGCAMVLVATCVRGTDVVAVLGFAAIILAAAGRAGIAERALGAAPVVWLGEVSFSIYLLHPLVLDAALALDRRYLGAQYGFWVIGIAAAAVLPLAWVTWRGIEIPAQARGRRWTGRSVPQGAQRNTQARAPRT